ncbi:2-isopropylmalate synthase/homocitrate synthase family protein [Solidesulfovibrio fructosivorans JJ]]|uniref:Citramalate synthase n=1 Tax=Solidesulfovibrio fructosivorans JJ] TaxID=596151 RepID=E1JWD8_SOLFR|nr:citramalate synthase [Solidesulfovibrio fructosivorans]EFL51235.1 2-isopropylmalate synthase/homocitrate synthase family protein [Solidesulfovibrio fructosivorans JJ]]
MRRVLCYDTTLRDGTQAEDISLTTEDKLRIALKLDELGLAYIEGGWPGSNPTDKRFFQEIQNYHLKYASIAAFGSTHNHRVTAETDPNLKALVDSGAPVVTIFGKSWDIHVTEALGTTLPRNLELVGDSLAYLRQHFREVFFDAEHFFDGYKANPDYALSVLRRAKEAGADVLVLCDTNGGTLPVEFRAIMSAVAAALPEARFGIHTHNDSGVAVANSLEAVELGAVQVQGTVNGYGERCGNANLCTIIPSLILKCGIDCLPEGKLPLLTPTAHFVSEMVNQQPPSNQPYVGDGAFAHKGGVHVSAVVKNPLTYEHVTPESVGNARRVLLSDLSGQSNILYKAREFGFELDKNDPFVLELLTTIKEREALGYEYTAAEASYELLLNRVLGRARSYFTVTRYRVLDDNVYESDEPLTEATVMIKVGGRVKHTASTGRGPINALDKAIRKALRGFYPRLAEMRLLDFKVRVLSGTVEDEQCGRGVCGTASHVRVLVESGDTAKRWVTVGVSHNVIEASFQAMEDAINYKLFSDDKEKLTKALKG